VLAQLQAPMDAYVNFTYATIYRTAGNRAAYREIAERTAAGQDQLPPIVLPFVEMQQAQVAIWDQDTDAALPHLERASELLGQSMIHLFRDNLSTASMYVMLAELYLDANASDDARQRLDDVLTVFPANGHAKLVYARVLAAEGDEAAARAALSEALEIWSGADAAFVPGVEARSMLADLTAR
jgi:hypothetical protein